jgi:UDP-N-acetylglucosamine transferase subunit ALG13
MDEIAPSLPLKVFIQLGCTQYRPKNAEWSAFLTFEEMMAKMSAASLIIGHASAGPILHSRKFQAPLIAVPRRPELNEHVDGHQVETGRAVTGLPMIEVVWEVPDLRDAILSILANPARLAEGRRTTGRVEELVQVIRDFVNADPAAMSAKAAKAAMSAKSAKSAKRPG